MLTQFRKKKTRKRDYGRQVGTNGIIRRLTRAELRAQAKFILNNWGL